MFYLQVEIIFECRENYSYLEIQSCMTFALRLQNPMSELVLLSLYTLHIDTETTNKEAKQRRYAHKSRNSNKKSTKIKREQNMNRCNSSYLNNPSIILLCTNGLLHSTSDQQDEELALWFFFHIFCICAHVQLHYLRRMPICAEVPLPNPFIH